MLDINSSGSLESFGEQRDEVISYSRKIDKDLASRVCLDTILARK